MFARRPVVSIAGLVAVLILAYAVPAVAQKPKPKPPLPGGVQPQCQTGCITYSVIVDPHNGTVTRPANSGPFTGTFTVSNTSMPIGTVDSYTFTCSSTGDVACGSVNPASATLSSGFAMGPTAPPAFGLVMRSLGGGGRGGAQSMGSWTRHRTSGAYPTSVDVQVTYTVGATGGTLSLTANSPFASDQGSYTVLVAGPPTVALRNHNGDNRDRSLCLTAGAGEAAAWGCGDLVVTHGLPSYATMGRERSLSLLYNSAQAVPKPVVAVAVTEGGNVAMPDSVHVELLVNGVPRATATYNSWGGTPATTRQIALTYDATADSTGLYPFTFLVRNKYASGNYDATVSDTLIVVNRSQSEFGAGWSLVGVERLVLAPGNRILWVGGDGSAKVYRNVGTNVWQGAAGGYRDTVSYDPGTTQYTRTLRHGVQVKFDAQGRHIQTVNRVGQTSTFTWSGAPARLISVQVPPGGSGTTYTLAYDGSGKLDGISDPVARALNATVVTGQLTSLVDPDLYSTSFGYDAAGRMTSRTTRRGFATKFVYAKSLRVTQVKVPLNPSVADTATTSFTPWDERGLAFGSGFQTAVDTATAYTKIDEPRTSVADTATFRVDRWGAPVKLVNPIGATTALVRGDAAVPALVTQVTLPDGRIQLMTWNARGNLTQTRDSTLQLTNGQPTAVTRWTYLSPNTQDAPDSIIDPEGLVARYTYNSWGLVSDAIASNGHVTHMDFVTSGTLTGLVQAVTEQLVPAWDTLSKTEPNQNLRVAFAFNALGNVVSDTSPAGRAKTYTRDGLQRVTNVYDPAGHRVEMVYDPLNRLLQSIQHVEGIDSGFAAPLVTRQHYDIDVLDSIIDPRGVIRRYVYDAADRRTAEIDDFGKTEATYYDRSGLVDSVRLRFDEGTSGFVTRYVYDAAGRTLKKAWPSRSPLVADSILFGYDIVNQWTTATQAARQITRTYYPTGLLRSEAQSAVGGTSPLTFMYAYDRAGRRTWYRTGTAGDLTFSDSIWYRYDAPSGDLRWIGVRWRRAYGPGTPPIKNDSVQFWWDGMGRRDTLIYSNNTRVKFAYDADGMTRLVCADHPGGPAIPDVFDFTYYHKSVNVDGMILGTTNWNTGLSGCGQNSTMQLVYTQTYDSRHQLKTQASGGGTLANIYDGSGNIIRTTTNTSDKVFVIGAGHNRLTQFYFASNPAVGTNYTYDWNGARFTEEPFCPGCNPATTLGARNYYYDGLGRMTGHQELACQEDPVTGSCTGVYSFGTSTECRYDPLGRMYDPCENAAPNLGFDGDNVGFTGPSDGSIYTWTFVHGPGVDDPIMGYHHTNDVGNDKYWYYMTDGQGRQFAVGDANGYDMSTDIQYYQNGGKLAGGTKNSNTFGADRNHNPGMYKMSFFRNRFYDQQTGRWTQEDPIGMAGGLNQYAFVGNNPVMFTDPFGLDCFDSKGNRIPCQPVPGHMRLATLNNNNTQCTTNTRGSGFVMRTRSNGDQYQHQGVDIAAAPGTEVSAMYDGTVTKVVNASNADDDNAGYRVTIRSDHDGKETTSYWHLSETSVKVGEHVQGGDVIGKSGTTGNANPATSGREAHLHARKQLNGNDVNPGIP